MKIVMVAIGWENISLQALSAMLKKEGHEVELVYDQALFDDKNYLKIDWLARLMCQKDLVAQRIIELKPDLVCCHVMTVQYQEMYDLMKRVKKHLRVPVIFGGIHAHSAPDDVLLKHDPVVDMVCMSEGDYALPELVASMETGRIDYSIQNILFRLEDGTIIKNPTRPLIQDLDTLPIIDKELFAPHFPIKWSYLSTPSRGCPYACTFCSLSFLAAEAARLKSKRIRERSPESLVNEIKVHIDKYKSAYVDFRQPVMATRESWILDFFPLYKKEIGLPFRCFMHPHLITRPAVKAMRDAGCFAIQIGVECWNEEIRHKVFNRPDRNDLIREAAKILEDEKQYYAFDYILGAPRLPKVGPNGKMVPLTEEETMDSFHEELMGFAEFIVPLKYMYRVAPFMLQYMPGTGMIVHGLNAGDLTKEDVHAMNSGKHDNYMASGSIKNPDRVNLLQGYRVMFRLMSFLPPWAKRMLLQFKAYKVFWMAPFRVFITVLDLMIAVRDKDAWAYAKNYVWWFMKRFDRNYHLYYFKKRQEFPETSPIFELPKDGILDPVRYRNHLAARSSEPKKAETDFTIDVPGFDYKPINPTVVLPAFEDVSIGTG